MTDAKKTQGPDLSNGIAARTVEEGKAVLGHAGDADVMLVRAGDRFFAVGAFCTHYRGNLADGLVVDETVRCPLHHACFSLRTGEALRAPALDPIVCWRVERQGDTVFVREKLSAPQRAMASPATERQAPASVIIVGGGAAGLAAADMLRREGYEGPVTLISADPDPPVDRPNLSKDYLAGEAQDDWIPLWPSETYAEKHIDLMRNCRVASLDPLSRSVLLDDGSQHNFGALLIATGADPIRPPIPGADGPRVRYLRSYADSRAIVEMAQNARHAVVIGASFIGLEVSASLRTRGIGVDVVAPEQTPLERVMGKEVGRFVQSLHEANGVVFHLGPDRHVNRWTKGHAERREDTRRRFRRDRRRREAGDLSRRKGGPGAGSRHRRERIPGNQRAGHIRGGRRGKMAGPAQWRANPCRALGGGRAAGSGRRAQYSGSSRTFRRRAVLLEPALRRHDSIRRTCGTLGCGADRRNARDRNCSVTYKRGGRTLAVASIGRDRENLAAEVELERAAASP